MKIRHEQKDMETSPDKNVFGKFRISSDDGKFLEGYVYSDHPRIIPRISHFKERDVVLDYGVDVQGLRDGDTVSGNLIAATDRGEAELPISVTVRDAPCPPDFDRITSLEDFADLARRDPRGAFRMFRSPYFQKLAAGNAKGLMLMKGLMVPPVTQQSMEEFLVLMGLKKKVEVRIVRTELTFENLREVVEEDAVLRRSGWGTLALQLSTKSPFLELPRQTITDEGFVGSVCDLPFRIRTDLLGETRRSGTILAEGTGVELSLTVTASSRMGAAGNTPIRMGRKRLTFFRQCLCFYLGEIDAASMRRTCLALLMEMKEPYITSLELSFARGYLALAGGDRAGLSAALEEMRAEEDEHTDSEQKLLIRYFAWAAGQADPDLPTDLRDRVRQQPGNIMIFLLYLELNPEARRLPQALLHSMREAYDTGCSSPFLYAEAWKIYEANPDLLIRLDSFSRQVLIFAIRHGKLSGDMALRTALLADSEKQYSPLVFRILACAYNEEPMDTILESICRYIIRGPARDHRCFPWYARAVDRGLRITRLYEYYLETMPENYQKEIPLGVRLYFLGDTNLPDKKRAFLYSLIVRNKEEQPETYQKYETSMRCFADESLRAGRLGEDYAVLYQEFADLSDSRTAENFADVLFAEQIFCDNPLVRRVVLVTEELREEESVSLVHGAAFIHRYTDTAEILFEDREGCRFRSGIAYSRGALINRRQFLPQLLHRHLSCPGLVLAQLRESETVSEDTLSEWAEAAEADIYSDAFQREARKKLLAYVLDNRGKCELDDFVQGLDDDEYAEADVGTLFSVLLSRGMYDRAFHIVTEYGTERMKTEDLIRLACWKIDENHGEEDEDLLCLAECVFRRGKYDERILAYLTDYYNSSLSLMTEVRNRAEDFYIDPYRIEERILARCVFSGETVPLGSKMLCHYSRKGGNPRLLVAYVQIASADSFDRDQTVDSYLGRVLEDLMDEDRCSMVMKLALLRYYTKKEGLTSREEMQIDKILDECMERNLLFAFFKDLPPYFLLSYRFADKEILEFREDPEAEVTIYYAFQSGQEKAVFVSEPMKKIYRGVRQKVFTLFYGERVTWYVKVKKGDDEYQSSQKICTGAYPDFTGRSRYQRINQMLRLMREGREEDMRERLIDYKRAVRQADQMFTLKEEK